ncbi:MAG: hypothetical protein AAF688_11505 [Bacteroidota bacterium]
MDSSKLIVDQIVGLDKYETIYYTKDAGLFKQQKGKELITYGNIQLGAPTTVDTFNPLKINLFYQDFNTLIVLDNRMTEVVKIDFNIRQPYLNISHLSTGADNSVWIFNQDLQQLQIFDYRNSKIRASAVPVQSNVLDLESDYNFAWLLTENYLYKYNYFGSLISKIENRDFKRLTMYNENLVIETETGLLFMPAKSDTPKPISLDTMLINQFLLNGETLYIYAPNSLRKYQLQIR